VIRDLTRSKILTSVILNRRHISQNPKEEDMASLSLMVTSQKYNMLALSLRCNMSHVIVFKSSKLYYLSSRYRHNIATNSYDVTSKGINRSFGTLIRPLSTEKAAGVQLVSDLVIGQAILPPLMEIELIGYITATGVESRLDKAASTIEIILELDYS
jgi:hypothetical protein